MNVRRWLHEHSLKLLAIRDTPEAIAGGIAIGLFFGFMPLFGLKTVSAIFFAWLTRSNIVAAVLAGTLHDLIFPFMPVVYIWEYKIGYWFMYHQWPEKMSKVRLHWHEWRNWTTFLSIGKPLLVGSIVCGIPLVLPAYYTARAIVARHQRKKHAHQHPPDASLGP